VVAIFVDLIYVSPAVCCVFLPPVLAAVSSQRDRSHRTGQHRRFAWPRMWRRTLGDCCGRPEIVPGPRVRSQRGVVAERTPRSCRCRGERDATPHSSKFLKAVCVHRGVGQPGVDTAARRGLTAHWDALLFSIHSRCIAWLSLALHRPGVWRQQFFLTTDAIRTNSFFYYLRRQFRLQGILAQQSCERWYTTWKSVIFLFFLDAGNIAGVLVGRPGKQGHISSVAGRGHRDRRLPFPGGERVSVALCRELERQGWDSSSHPGNHLQLCVSTWLIRAWRRWRTSWKQKPTVEPA